MCVSVASQHLLNKRRLSIIHYLSTDMIHISVFDSMAEALDMMCLFTFHTIMLICFMEFLVSLRHCLQHKVINIGLTCLILN